MTVGAEAERRSPPLCGKRFDQESRNIQTGPLFAQWGQAIIFLKNFAESV